MKSEVKSYLFQRKMLGILCGLLAPTSVLFGLFGLEHNLPGWYLSISATYYASSSMCMIGLLFSAAVFFICYGGHDSKDRVLSAIQAVGCLGVVTFPCKTPFAPSCVGMFDLPIDVSNVIHCVCACMLFIAFGVNIMFLFTLGNKESKTNEMKMKRNKVYRICGGIIFAFCLIQGLTATPLFDWVPEWFPLTLLNEFVMLEAFAVAWLVKSCSISRLNDRKPHEKRHDTKEIIGEEQV